MGFGAAGYLDLKTTEFPDWLPYSIIIASIAVRAVFSFIMGDFTILTNSFIIGGIFLGIGLALYYTNQWGDGDAWLLGAMGFVFPDPAGFSAMTSSAMVSFPFPITLISNMFFVAFFYLIGYSILLGVRNPDVWGKFVKHLRKGSHKLGLSIAIFSAICAGIFFFMHLTYLIPVSDLVFIAAFPLLFTCLIIFMQYGKFIEGNLFKKRINVKDLRPGDVPANMKWKVLTSKEINALKKTHKKIWIKEGVRFAPVFIITILMTLFWGNLMMLVMF